MIHWPLVVYSTSSIQLGSLVLPLMSNLSKLFQTSPLSYSHNQPSIQSTKSRIIAQDNPLDDLIRDVATAGGRFAQAEVTVIELHKAFLGHMVEKYKMALEENIDDRF